jgi:hypothetical protein
MCDDDFRASAGSDPPRSDQQQSETTHYFPLVTSVASDQLFVLVIFIPKCGPQERVVLLRRGFTELARDAILIVTALHGCHGRGVGSEIRDCGRSFVAATPCAGSGIAATSRCLVSAFASACACASASASARRTGVGGRATALLRELALLSAHLTVEVAERLVEFFVST